MTRILPPRPTRRSSPPPEDPSGHGLRARMARISLGTMIRPESSNYFLLLGTTLFLTLFGLVMVLSSSTIDSYSNDQGFLGVFGKQAMFAALGIPLMLVVSRLPLKLIRQFSWVPLVLGMALQLLVLTTSLGVSAGGNRNWLNIAGFSLQPSELIKLGLVAWIGAILVRKEPLLDKMSHVFIPLFPVAGLAILLVMLGGDLGTVVIMASLLFGSMFYAGIRLRTIGIPVALAIVLAGFIAMGSESRIARITEFFADGPTDDKGISYQSIQGINALANGGVFGVGLGNSTAKWSWLPEAENDFIFAVIGEELGLIGTVVVLALFVTMAVAFLRILRKAPDLFSRVLVGGVMVWVVMQAFVNIAVVLDVLPVLGVPLPFISAGGSALLTTLAAVGLVLAVARAETLTPKDSTTS